MAGPNKICPKCNAAKHVRVSTCDCGHQFYAKKGEVKSEVVTETKPTGKFSLIGAIKQEEIKPIVTETKPSTTSIFSKLITSQESGKISRSEIVIEDKHLKPGPGKKQCSGCQKYVGVRSSNCPLCNYDFSSKEKVEIEQPKVEVITKKFDGPGKGRKECPKCHSFVGARTSECECGYNFESKILIKEVSKKLPFVEEKPKGIFGLIAEAKVQQQKEEKKQKEKEQGLVKFQIEGRGKKVCPSCYQKGERLCYVPVATRICDCGHVFEKKEKYEGFKRPEKPIDDFYKGTYTWGNGSFPLSYNLNDANDKKYQIFVDCLDQNKRKEYGKGSFTDILHQEIDQYLILNNKKQSGEVVNQLKETGEKWATSVIKKKYDTDLHERYFKLKKSQWIYSNPEIIVESIKEHFGTEYNVNWSWM